MSSQVERLSARLDAAFEHTGATADLRTLTQPLLKLLSAGQPVTAEQLAAATGRSAEQIHATLPSLPSIELDTQARVIGMGITLNPTRPTTSMSRASTSTNVVCPGTLIFPALIGRTAHVTSPCHGTGETVRLTVSPDRVFDITRATPSSPSSPQTTSPPSAPPSATKSFFASPEAASPEAASPRLAEHRGATVLPITDALALAAKQFTFQAAGFAVEPGTEQFA